MLLTQEISDKIDAIDLTNIKKRLRDPMLGKGWSTKKVNTVEKKYRNFLRMIAQGGMVVPTKSVDEMWHEHILRTNKYQQDCLAVFGKFIHHDPDVKPEVLKLAWKRTQAQYKDMFGAEYGKPDGKKGDELPRETVSRTSGRAL